VPTPLEAEISSLLKIHDGNASRVAEELAERLERNLFTDDEVKDCFQFLLNAGLLPLFFHQMQKLIARHGRLPWTPFMEALALSKIALEEPFAKALFEGAENQEATTELVLSRALDSAHPGFAERRALVDVAYARKLGDKLQELKDQLAYMRANRMYEQEAAVLDEIQALFPEERSIQAERESNKIRWAREIIANSNTTTDPLTDLNFRVDRLTPDQLKSKDLIVARALELAEQSPRLAYDLAISLHMMDLNMEALNVLQNAEFSPAAEWLRLELLVRSRQFVNALEEAARLEVDHASDPNAAFTVTYARARALYGLGQTQTAIELMQSLVNIRPHYRSAQSLLREWTGGES